MKCKVTRHRAVRENICTLHNSIAVNMKMSHIYSSGMHTMIVIGYDASIKKGKALYDRTKYR